MHSMQMDLDSNVSGYCVFRFSTFNPYQQSMQFFPSTPLNVIISFAPTTPLSEEAALKVILAVEGRGKLV